MKQALYLIYAAILLLIFMMFMPEQTISKPGPRTVVLSERNTVSLNMPINAESAMYIQHELMTKAKKLKASETVYLTLNSPGGSRIEGQKIIETAQGLPNPVNTISIFSASMSFIISQYLDRRLVLETGTMMSHRAYAEGVGGQVPGNLVTRALGLLKTITEIDAVVAKRSGMGLKEYQALIQDELWMNGQEAVTRKFADEVVRIYCDRTLQGEGNKQHIRMLGSEVVVVWDKCPLFTKPIGLETKEKIDTETRNRIYNMLYNRSEYIRNRSGEY